MVFDSKSVLKDAMIYNQQQEIMKLIKTTIISNQSLPTSKQDLPKTIARRTTISRRRKDSNP